MPVRSLAARSTGIRRGFTLVEMLVSMAVFTLVMGIIVPFFVSQSRTSSTQTNRSEAMRNAQFAFGSIDRDLRMAGIGVGERQPTLVYANNRAITFNADLVERDSAGYTAVYYDPDAEAGTTAVLPRERRIILPLSAFQYPESTYRQTGAGSPLSTAETISYWASADSSSPYPNEFVIWRRENDAPPRAVSKGIRLLPGQPLFTYYKSDSLKVLAPAELPVWHSAPVHDSPADTGVRRVVDSIRVVKVRLDAVARGREASDTIVHRIEGYIRMLNAGLVGRTTCGEAPLFGSPVAAVALIDPDGVTRRVRISWNRAIDEGGGENDVERYGIYRRRPAEVFTDAFSSVSAGLLNYEFDDLEVLPGEDWIYGIAAQDCSPTLSGITAAPMVTIP